MKLPHSVCEVLRNHVVLKSECIDRMYLNVYVPQLQRIGGDVWYLRGQRNSPTAAVEQTDDRAEGLLPGLAANWQWP
jgi:hypothetical protein